MHTIHRQIYASLHLLVFLGCFFFLTFCSTSLDTDDSCNISPKNPAKHFHKTDADVKDKLGEAPKKIFTSLKGVQRTG